MNVNNNNSINNSISKTTFGSNVDEKKVETMQNSLNELVEMMERGAVPEYGKCNSIYSRFLNMDEKVNASDIVISVEPSILLDERPTERELNVKVYSKAKSRSYAVTLFRGENKEILEKLKSEEISSLVGFFVQDASSKFNEYD